MTYRPAVEVFGPPWSVRIWPLLYLLLALGVTALVLIGESSPSNSRLFVYVVEQDQHRILGARALALALVVSSLAAIVRSNMRGVRVRPDGVEYRDVINHLWPRARRYKWAQIDRILLDQKDIALDLWDTSRTFLPAVANRDRLAAVLEKVGVARAIPVRGGGKLDELPESGDYPDE
jgi:hypothetical protein